jgi:hypothetical protein
MQYNKNLNNGFIFCALQGFSQITPRMSASVMKSRNRLRIGKPDPEGGSFMPRKRLDASRRLSW